MFLGVTFFGLYKILITGTVSWDEPIQLARGLHQLAFGLSTIIGKPIAAINEIETLSSYPYGIIQKLPATLLSLILWVSKDPELKFSSFPSGEYYRISHLFTFLYSILTCWLLLKSSIRSKLTNYWIAPLLLISSPMFMGHSFFNIKDIPFAFLYTLFSYSLINLFNATTENIRNRNIFSSLIMAAFCSLKITIFPIIFLEYSFVLFLTFKRIGMLINKKKIIVNTCISFLLLSTISVLILLPVSWESPVSYIISSFNVFKNHPWDGCMNFDGICSGKFNISGKSIYPESISTWSTIKYIAKWSSIQLTILNLFSLIASSILFLTSILFLIRKKDLSNTNISRLIYGSQLTFIPIAAMVFNSNIYDSIRHLLFIFPAFCYLTSDFLDLIIKKVRINLYKNIIFMMIGVNLFFNFIDFSALSPYQYTYINEFSRQKHLNGVTDLDYWGVSVGELYDLSKDLLGIFPDHVGPPTHFRMGNHITKKGSNNLYTSQMIFRPPSGLNNLHSQCKEISSVERTYPLTKDKAVLSSLVVCPKKQ